MECFEDDGTIKARRAFDMYYSYANFVDADETFKLFREVVDAKGIETDYFVINPLSKLLYDRVLEDRIDHAEASSLALEILDIIDHGRANCEGEYCQAWNVINEYSPPLLSALEGIKGFYPCDYFMERYYAHYEADPADCDNITEVYLKMVWGGCSPDMPRMMTLKEAKDSECYVAPPPPGPLRLAYNALEQGQFREAITKFEEYIAAADDPEKKAKYQLVISKIYYAHIKNFPEARRYARGPFSR